MQLKNIKQHLSKLMISLAVFGLSACATNKVPDVPTCVELSMDSGYCRWTISDRRQLVTEKNPLVTPDGRKQTWWEMRHSTVRVPAYSWGEIKKFIIKVCHENNICQKEVSSWDRAVSDIDTWLKENDR